jgi:hypothetical protein
MGRPSRVWTAKTTCELPVSQQGNDFALAMHADRGAARYRLPTVRTGTRGFDLDVGGTLSTMTQERSHSIFHAVG